MTDDELIMYLDRQSQLRHKTTRDMLIEAGRPDLAEDLDRRMKDIRSGISQAVRVWHSISAAQRFVLEAMGRGRYLARSLRSVTQFDALGTAPAILGICRLATARRLCAHELIHVNGGATDPEAMFVITERGKFVLAKGRAHD